MRIPFWISQLKKDFLWSFSYKITFFGQFVGIFITTYTIFFLAKTFEFTESEYLTQYKNNYFLFAILGISIVELITTCMRTATMSIRESQTLGYLDTILNSKIRMHSYIACTMIYPFIFGLFKISCYLSLAYIIKPFDISIESLLLSLIIGAMGLLSLVGFSFISCAFVLVFKQGDPVNYILTISITLLAGVLFPVSALPSFMQNLSNMLPISHSLEIMRKVIIFNSPEYFLPEVFGFLLIFMFTTAIFGVIILEFAIKQVKMRGTSGDY